MKSDTKKYLISVGIGGDLVRVVQGGVPPVLGVPGPGGQGLLPARTAKFREGDKSRQLVKK